MLQWTKLTDRAPFLLCILAALLSVCPAGAQKTASQPAGSSKLKAAQQKKGEYTLHANVTLVVLHATVANKKGQIVDDLGKNDFAVYEDGVQQKLAVFSHTDIPVTMGIV
ncbi:MAG: hypothetical protein ACRD22_19195, partial [Terriglobia bacterium]